MKTLIVKNGVALSYVKERMNGESEFATHKVKEEKDGSLNKFWGHYFTAFYKAKESFISRQQ